MTVVRRVRMAVLAFAVINLIIMIAFYSFQAYLNNNSDKYQDEPRIPNLVWQDYVEIVCSVLFVGVYLYALIGFRFVPKTARVVLLLIPTVLILYVSINAMVDAAEKDGGAFKCGARAGGGNRWCALNWTNKFLSALLGFFVLFELGLTMVWGPMEPKRDYLPQNNENLHDPIVHDGGQTGSTHAMVEHSQQAGVVGAPAGAAAVLGNASGSGTHQVYPPSQKPVLLGDINNNNKVGAESSKAGHEQELPPPQVIYEYPAPQTAQFQEQHKHFQVPQPIPVVLPTVPEATIQMPSSQQAALSQPQSQPFVPASGAVGPTIAPAVSTDHQNTYPA
ncbi:hypothetical protein BGX23_011415 [Mortierella sp. AD031]|nr:hypothetical protein BGX23_011415 [Mortierella sp. AD031]